MLAIGCLMEDVLHRIDPDYYREARLRIARASLKQLRREREALAEVEGRNRVPLGTMRSTDAIASLRSRR
jgi:multidrug resistance efflux pump